MQRGLALLSLQSSPSCQKLSSWPRGGNAQAPHRCDTLEIVSWTANTGQLHTLSVLEQLREASKGLWGASSEAYWDQSDQHIRWVIAASASVAVGHAAMDASIANYPDQRFTLRNGILVIRQHPRT